MTDGLLENIIHLEKQIQANVAAEQVRAEQWQEHELAALESSLAEARTATKERRGQILAEKKAELLCAGADIEAAAADWCQRLAKLDDAALVDVLKRHLAAVLPGGDYDHPHGQS